MLTLCFVEPKEIFGNLQLVILSTNSVISPLRLSNTLGR